MAPKRATWPTLMKPLFTSYLVRFLFLNTIVQMLYKHKKIMQNKLHAFLTRSLNKCKCKFVHESKVK